MLLTGHFNQLTSPPQLTVVLLGSKCVLCNVNFPQNLTTVHNFEFFFGKPKIYHQMKDSEYNCFKRTSVIEVIVVKLQKVNFCLF